MTLGLVILLGSLYLHLVYIVTTFVYGFVVIVSLMMHSEFSLKSFVEVGCLFSFLCHVSCYLCHLQY